MIEDQNKNQSKIKPVRYITIKHRIQSNSGDAELRERFDKIFENTAIIVDIEHE